MPVLSRSAAIAHMGQQVPWGAEKSVTETVCFCTGFCLFLLVSTGVDIEVHQTRKSQRLLLCTVTRITLVWTFLNIHTLTVDWLIFFYAQCLKSLLCWCIKMLHIGYILSAYYHSTSMHWYMQSWQRVFEYHTFWPSWGCFEPAGYCSIHCLIFYFFYFLFFCETTLGPIDVHWINKNGWHISQNIFFCVLWGSENDVTVSVFSVTTGRWIISNFLIIWWTGVSYYANTIQLTHLKTLFRCRNPRHLSGFCP